jgi:hypothetical protein
MANYCYNKITAGATNSEWQEISKAFSNDQIDWRQAWMEQIAVTGRREISLTTKWSPTPWNEGKMEALSRSYPSVLFHYVAEYEGGERPDSVWFANGEEGNKKDGESYRKQAHKAEVERLYVRHRQRR